MSNLSCPFDVVSDAASGVSETFSAKGPAFVQYFAPVLESLRELVEIPYDRILPPRLHKQFAASVKLTFTRDGEKDIPVIAGSSFNVVVTNTEKIRIQKETIRKADIGGLFGPGEENARRDIANRRLQAIASPATLGRVLG